MRLRQFLPAALLALLAMVPGCGGSDGKQSGASEATKVSEQTAPSRDHPQLIYTTPTQPVLGPNNTLTSTRKVIAVDLQTGASSVLAEYDGNAGNAGLSDRYLMYATPRSVTLADTNGRNPREVFHLPQVDNVYINHAALSPDGTKLALIFGGSLGGAGILVFIDTQSGRELRRIERSDPKFAGLEGSLGWLQWRADSEAVVVSGVANTHRAGDSATVTPAGDVRVHVLDGFIDVAPDGRHASEGPEVICSGLLISGHTLNVRELSSGRVVASVSDATKAYTPWAWSPDGREFLYQERDFSGGDCWGPPPRWGLLTTSGSVTPVTDLTQLYGRWYGKRLVMLECPDAEQPVLYRRWGFQFASCNVAAGSSVDVLLAQKPVAQVEREVEVLGFLNY